jgi:hypothetical protein
VLRGEPCRLRLQSGDPIAPANAPRAYDSRLEAALARDLRRLAPDWEVIREPAAVESGDTLVFPDFGLRHRVDGRSWPVEVVGFWTPDYVARKLARLRAAGLHNLILCIDESRCCSDAELPAGARLVRYRRRIDASAVVRILGGAA